MDCEKIIKSKDYACAVDFFCPAKAHVQLFELL